MDMLEEDVKIKYAVFRALGYDKSILELTFIIEFSHKYDQIYYLVKLIV